MHGQYFCPCESGNKTRNYLQMNRWCAMRWSVVCDPRLCPLLYKHYRSAGACHSNAQFQKLDFFFGSDFKWAWSRDRLADPTGSCTNRMHCQQSLASMPNFLALTSALWLEGWASRFNVPINTLQVISETSLSSQSLALILTTRTTNRQNTQITQRKKWL